MAVMIPVTPQPPPAKFDEKVRQPGLAWLIKKNINLTAHLPSNTNPHPYWRECLDDLHKSYAGICAYLAMYIDPVTGAVTTDHFVAKSANAGLIYEWSNYRLACGKMNARKRAFDDVMDPFTLPADVFRLELVSGRIFVNPSITGDLVLEAEATIERLNLDSSIYRSRRYAYYQEYLDDHHNLALLRKYSPFVYYEAQRQGLL
jgi:uncharacterized protein (TIGR02646 family)